MRLEVGERDELEGRGVRRLEDDRRSNARLECLLPASGNDAPAIARLEAREEPLRLRSDEVVSPPPCELEELFGHHRADDVNAHVARTGAAVAVAVETGHGVERTRLEFAAEDVHGDSLERQLGGPAETIA